MVIPSIVFVSDLRSGDLLVDRDRDSGDVLDATLVMGVELLDGNVVLRLQTTHGMLEREFLCDPLVLDSIPVRWNELHRVDEEE